MSESVYMSAKEAAEYLKVSVAILKRLGLGVSVSPRRTVYRRADLDAYVEARASGSGSGPAPAPGG